MTAIVIDDLHRDIRAWLEAGDRLYWPQGDCSIFYRDVGSTHAKPDKTLLLLHGFPESSFSFHKVVERLLGRFERLVFIDFPGYGLSDKPTRLTYSLFEQTDALLFAWRELGVSGGHVLAHDMGDSIATELVARATQELLPGWFASGMLSLTCTDGNMVMEEATLVPTQVIMRKPVIGPILNRFTNLGLFRNQVKRANGPALALEDIDNMWQLNTLQNGHRLFWKLVKYLDERDRFQHPRWLRALSLFRGPVHICWGESDNVSPPAVAHYLKDNICRDARLTLMPGVGHFCQLQAPDQWCEAVLGFYKDLGE